MDNRSSKQTIIAVIFFISLVVIIAALFFLLKPDPTCSDKKQNQGESGVDCGGPCAACPVPIIVDDLIVEDKDWVYDIDNKYDAAIKLKNPNNLYGAASFNFRVTLVDSAGQTLVQSSSQEGFILPGETKYLLVAGMISNTQPSDIRVEITNPQWQKFTDYEAPNFIINNNRHEQLSGGAAGFFRANGTLINDSRYDFERIVVKVLVWDANGTLLAINHQSMNTVRAREQRDYNILFPHSFPGTINNVEVQPEVNVFDSDNYVKIKGRPQNFDPRGR